MEQFLSLLKQIGVFMIAAQLLLLCCGNQKFEKYIKLLTGLLVLCFLTVPFLSLTGKDFLAGLREELKEESSWQMLGESLQETGEWQLLSEEGVQKEEDWSSQVQISPIGIQKVDIPKIQVSGGDIP